MRKSPNPILIILLYFRGLIYFRENDYEYGKDTRE